MKKIGRLAYSWRVSGKSGIFLLNFVGNSSHSLQKLSMTPSEISGTFEKFYPVDPIYKVEVTKIEMCEDFYLC